jgi:hypothetical protein
MVTKPQNVGHILFWLKAVFIQEKKILLCQMLFQVCLNLAVPCFTEAFVIKSLIPDLLLEDSKV